MNKIIKLKTFQERAVFRVPYSMEIIESYPLPPYSTILGFIHNMLLSQSTLPDINISVQGKYGNVNREYVRYQKYEKEEIEGKPYPIIITSLIDLELIIHIRMPTEELHNKLLHSLKNPPYFPYLGRPEDLICKMEVKEVLELEIDIDTAKEGMELLYNCYLPYEKAQELQLDGIYYLLPSYYRINTRATSKKAKSQEIFRDFEMIKVIYAQSGQIFVKPIKIDNEETPIWWMK